MRTVAKELKDKRVKDFHQANGLIIAKLDPKLTKAVREGLSIQSFSSDRISPALIRRLPPKTARMAKFYNYTVVAHQRRLTDGQVRQHMKDLHLEIKANKVYDKLEKKFIGDVKSEEKQSDKGNWCMLQNYGWYRIPGWFGFWEKLWCKTRTYKSACGGDRIVRDVVVAEVDGPQHYAAKTRYNASIAYVYDWDYIWIGESHCGTAYSYAREGNQSLDLTSRIC